MTILSIIHNVEDYVSDVKSHYRQKEFETTWECLRLLTDFLMREVGTTDNPGQREEDKSAD